MSIVGLRAFAISFVVVLTVCSSPMAEPASLEIRPAEVVSREIVELHFTLHPFGNVDCQFEGAFELYNSGAPSEVIDAHMAESDSGSFVVEGLDSELPGPQHLVVMSDGMDDVVLPFLAHETLPEQCCYFGDAHFHTGSDTGQRGWEAEGGDHHGYYTTNAFAYQYARFVAGLDWASSAPHVHGLQDSEWVACQDEADLRYVPGRSTTLYSYEWNAQARPHRIIYFKEARVPRFVGREPAYDTFEELVDAVEAHKLQAMISPHMHETSELHPVWNTVCNHLQRFGEIYSCKNSVEYGFDVPDLFELDSDDPWSDRFGGSARHVIGIVGSTDDHTGRPGRVGFGLNPERGAGGLAVVLATANTREGT